MPVIDLPYGDDWLSLSIPKRNLLAVASPNIVLACLDPLTEIRRALKNPIGMEGLCTLARGVRQVVIVADDMTRMTPVEIIIPCMVDELNQAGISDEQITILIALGTHRPMTQQEIAAHFGPEVIERVRVLNHDWHNPAALVNLGKTPSGTPVSVNRLAYEADLLLGVGSVVPHHIPGFSGGAKIIQPGITGPETTGATHFLSTRADPTYLGQVENPVRAEIEQIAARVGLRAILNVVLDPAGRLLRAFYGHPVAAHRAAVAQSIQTYTVRLPSLADIVIGGSHPCDIEFWQAHKSLYPAQMAVKPGGSIIVVTPAPEGVSATHAGMLSFTSLAAGQILQRMQDGTITDQVSGALALAWAKVRQHAQVSLVSGGIPADHARALGFYPFASVHEALQAALKIHGQQATVTVLPNAPDSLPLIASAELG